MFRRLLQLFRRTPASRPAISLPSVDRELIAPFLSVQHGLPHPDWGAIDAWIVSTTPDPAAHADLRRGAAAAWLDELRDSLHDDHRRWRSPRVEGLGPLDDDLAPRAARATDQAFKVIEPSLAPIRGPEPIPPVGIIALATYDSFLSFLSRNPDQQGESATAGGVYINDGPDAFPLIVFPTSARWAIEDVISHELAHHALHEANLPLFIEEGLTQMMEERVTGQTDFKLDRQMLQRHRDHWLGGDLDRYIAGTTFWSPQDDEQELSYHLSEYLVRTLLTHQPQRFFAFARACRTTDPETAAAEHLDATLRELVEAALSPAS